MARPRKAEKVDKNAGRTRQLVTELDQSAQDLLEDNELSGIVEDSLDPDGSTLTREEETALREMAEENSRRRPSLDPEEQEDDEEYEKSRRKSEDDDEDEQDRGGDDEDEDEEDDREYSRKVQSRVQREQRLKREARERAAEANRRAQQAEDQAQENMRLRIETEKKMYEIAEEAQKTRIEYLSEALTVANQDGRYEDATKIQRQLAEAIAYQQTAVNGKTVKERELNEWTEKSKQRKEQANQPNQQLPDEARRWMRKNSWYERQSDPEAVAYVNNVLAPALRQQGYNWEDPDFYEELNRRLYSRFRELSPRQRQDKAKQEQRFKRPSTPPTAGVGRGGSDDGAPRSSGNKLKDMVAALPARERAWIKQIGIDINNPKEMAFYFNNKRNQFAR